MKIIGIDPGLSGAAASYDTLTHAFTTHRFINTNGTIDVVCLAEYLNLTSPDSIFVEKIFLTGREGGQSAVTIGSNYGRILATLEINNLIYTEVPPRVWQRALGLKGGSRTIVKEEAKDLAVNRFGLTSFMFGKSKKPHDGCTDAACIALYGQLTLENLCKPKKKLTKSTQTSAPSLDTQARRLALLKDKQVSLKPNLKSRLKKQKLPVKAK